MKLRDKATATMDEVGEAARRTGEAAGWVGVALVAITAVSLLALGVATLALVRTGGER